MPRNLFGSLRIPLMRTMAGLAIGTSLLAASATAAPSVKPTSTPSPTAAPLAGPYSASKPPVSVSKARAHKLRPSHTIGAAAADDGDDLVSVAKAPKVFKKTPTLDAVAFSQAVHAALKDKVRGYSLVVRRKDSLAAHMIWDRAKSPSEGDKRWTIDTRMHVASVSKLLTAMTIVDLLDEKGISINAKIGPYIPDYWEVGNNVADITFRDLMRHISGFSSSDGSLETMKAEVAGDVPASADSDYANINFSLLRVLGATAAGWIPVDTRWDDEINDQMWDIAATQWLIARANSRLLAPAGVAPMSPIPNGDSAYGYSGAGDDDGWNSGDMSTDLGGVGFRLSPNEVAKVMGTFRRSGTVVSDDVAEAAIADRLGINGTFDVPGGKAYYRKGRWGSSNTEQSVAYYMPGDVEIVLCVNSWIGAEKTPPRNVIETAYLASLKSTPVPTAAGSTP